MESNHIVIKLAESSNARSFEETNLIHQREFNKVRGWVDDRIKNTETNSGIRLHDTITILGSRGSGKTTFLLSLLENYKKNNDVEVLDIIDPTLIEEKGHIFLTIIAQIADSVEKKLSKSDCDPESGVYQKKKVWREKLKRLAGGIPSLDGVGGNMDGWQDAEFIMDKGLRSVKSAKNFEVDFHDLVKLSLNIIEKKVFIITLDDIDIDFRKGWPVLEMIRKYLTSPYIITLLSGDMKLFSQAIRKQQWKNFGKALLKNEGENQGKMADYNDFVTEMEGQYLQKVMQPQRRIHLTTLLEKINLYGLKRENTNKDLNEDNENKLIFLINSEKGKEIQDFYDDILSKFGIKNIDQAEAYRSFLLSLPVRTQIQFLSEFENSNKESIENVNVTDPFLSDLYEKRVDIDYAKSTTKFLNSIILGLLLKEKVLDEAYQIQPTTTDISLNSSLISLSLLFSQKANNNPFVIFDYFIRIGYVRNLLSVLGYQEGIDGKAISQLKPSIEGLCKHSAIFQDRGSRDIVCYITAYIRAFLNFIEVTDDGSKNKKTKQNYDNWGGTIPLPGFAFKAKKGTGSDFERIDSVFKNSDLFKQQIAYIPLSVSQPSSKQQSLPTYSIYTLLGAIAESIRQYNDLDNGLSQLSQVRSYPMPNFINSTSDELEPYDVFDVGNPQEDPSELGSMMRTWIEGYSNVKAVTPHLLGKISTRFFYALRNIEDKDPSDNLGDAMHRRIIILLNSILLEDTKENIKEVKLSNNNPNFKPDIFIENLKKLVDENQVDRSEEVNEGMIDKLTFSQWMLSCPLLLLYLNFDDTLKNPLLSFISSGQNRENTEQLMAKSIYNELKKVGLQTIQRAIFSSTPENIRQTITNLKSLYTTSQSFLDTSNEDIRSTCRSHFQRIQENSIDAIKNAIRNNPESW